MRLTQRRWKRSGWRLCRAGYRLDLIQYFLLLIHGIFLFSPCTHFSYQFEVHTHFHDQIRLCEQEIRLYELKSVFETYIYSLNGHLTRKSVYAESPLVTINWHLLLCIYVTIPANTRYNLIIGWFTVEEISHKRIFSWDAHLESKYVSHKRIRFCEQSVYAKSPLHTCLNCEFV